MSLLKTPLCPFLTSLRTRQRIGGKNLLKAASKAFKAAELLLAPPCGALEDLQALRTALGTTRIGLRLT